MSTQDVVDHELVSMMNSVFAAQRPAGDRPRVPVRLDTQLWKNLESLGLTRLTGTELAGGSGAGWHESAALLGAAARHAVRLPLAEHDLLAGWLLEKAGLPPDDAIRTACVLDGKGVARAVPWAGAADHVVVLCDTGAGWRVADLPASEIGIGTGHNLAGEPRDDVTVDLAIVDGPAVGDETVHEFFLRGALARSLQMCAALERIVQLCVAHTIEREQFGRALARFQAVQQLVADIAAETALARAAVDAAVGEVAPGWDGDAGFHVAVAKSCAGHAASVVVRNAHQIHGAIGTTAEHELHEFTNPVLAWRSEFGSVHHWDQLLTTAATGAGRAGCWSLVAGPVRPSSWPHLSEVSPGAGS